MRGSVRTSTGVYDGGGGGGSSIVEQTTDIINRFRNSIVRSRKERLLDDDVQATENILHQLQFSELLSKETLGKLILQGDSMQRSYRLINQLEKEIQDIADDLNEVKVANVAVLVIMALSLVLPVWDAQKEKEEEEESEEISSTTIV